MMSNGLTSVVAEESAGVESFTTEHEEALAASGETFEFQAEVNRLMDIIINSL